MGYRIACRGVARMSTWGHGTCRKHRAVDLGNIIIISRTHTLGTKHPTRVHLALLF